MPLFPHHRKGPAFCLAGCILAGLLFLPLPSPGWQQALAPRPLVFPRDHGSHPDFQTEWWYVTGILAAGDGREFGYQFTIFRHGLREKAAVASPWAVRDLFIFHTALADFSRQEFHFYQDISRSGPGIAGADPTTLKTWFKGQEISCDHRGRLHLRSQAPAFSFRLTLVPGLPAPVRHGDRGLSRKGTGRGQASYYYSLPALAARGTITLAGKTLAVSGSGWFDHEFATNQLARQQQGWDWLSLTLSDGHRLMIYRLRRRDGSLDPASSGTYIFPDGRWRTLTGSDFSLTPHPGRWVSPRTGSSYPLRWRLRLRQPRDLVLEITPRLAAQEVDARETTLTAYWEGAVTAVGKAGEQPLTGSGYLELTGYGRSLPPGKAKK